MSGFLFDPGPTLPEGWAHEAGRSTRSAGRWVHRDGWIVRKPLRSSWAVSGPLGEPVLYQGRPYWPSLKAVLDYVAEREGQRVLFGD